MPYRKLLGHVHTNGGGSPEPVRKASQQLASASNQGRRSLHALGSADQMSLTHISQPTSSTKYPVAHLEHKSRRGQQR